jgi:hypothetical protein
MSVILHLATTVLFFGAAVQSYRAARIYNKAKSELQDLYKEGKDHIAKISHTANTEALKWILKNSTE